MSNETISVPRELLERVCANRSIDAGWIESADAILELRALLAQPAEQHQGADMPPKDSAGALADALESSDWPGVSIGNKVLIAAAIQHLRARYSEQHQGEPVAWMDPQSGRKANTISNALKLHNESKGGAPAAAAAIYTVPLFRSAGAPAAVVLPERKIINVLNYQASIGAEGWNACLDEVARLNPPQQ